MTKKLSPFNFTKAVMRSFMAESGLEPRLLHNRNRLQTIHGGTIASLVDLGGSLAVASTGRFATGVSTDLNVTYLSPGGRPGDILKGTAICEKIGKTLAYTTVQFYNSKGQLAARGSHTKHVTQPPFSSAITDYESRFVSGTLGPDGAFVAPAKWADEVD
ncbi:4HBT domain-containing protein [Trichoderma simmonsii]|uniref:4HBT domain-containing protein n=1 Tax=Trichoderma simmonsii TaxID=1491479 RepID=A0A8G0L5H9_9HYPO|nr:4HBT domain-containing protein [Trichoderma simmonsii]